MNVHCILSRAAWCPRSGSRILLGTRISAFAQRGPISVSDPGDPPFTTERTAFEATLHRLKDFSRIATRYDKLARNYDSAVALASVITF